MDYRFLKLIICIFVCVTLFIIIVFSNNHNKVSFDEYENISINYHYGEKNFVCEIESENDVLKIKELLFGRIRKDKPSCGFSEEISITLFNDDESITLCPAQDNCPKLRINDSENYVIIDDKQRGELNNILKKYGVIFPCV